MSSGISYPAALPAWLQSGHAREPAPVSDRVPFEYGPARMRRQFTDSFHLASVSTVLRQPDFDTFYDFHEKDLLAGARSFNVPVAGPGYSTGIEWWEAVFAGPWKAVYKLDGAVWIITAQLRLIAGPFATRPQGPLAAEGTVNVTGDASLNVLHGLGAEGAATATGDAKLDPIAQRLAAEGAASVTGDALLDPNQDALAAEGTASVTGDAKLDTAVQQLAAEGTAGATGAAALDPITQALAAEGAAGATGDADLTDISGSLTPTASNVVFEFHGDALPAVDSGYVPHGIANYSATIDTSVKPSFMTGSLKIGASTQGARAAVGASDASLHFGTGSWFMEAQVYGVSGSGARIFDTRAQPGQNGWAFTVDSSNNLYFAIDGVIKATTTGGPVTAATWKHVVASYDGTSIRLFVDGALSVTTAVSLNITTGQHLAVGNTNDMASGNGYTNQRLAEMRIVKGQSVVTAAFTAPTAKMQDAGTAALALQTNVTYSNVVLRSVYDADIADKSTYTRTMTASGAAAYSATQAKFGAGSLSTPANADYVSTPNATELSLGTGDYQFQCWAYQTSANSNGPSVLSCYTNSTTGYLLSIGGTSPYVPSWNSHGDGATITFVDGVPLNTWTHLAVSRKDGVLYSFVNGVLQRFVSESADTPCGGTLFLSRLNNTYTTYGFHGYIDDLQLVKAECKLFQSFLVATAALPVS